MRRYRSEEESMFLLLVAPHGLRVLQCRVVELSIASSDDWFTIGGDKLKAPRSAGLCQRGAV